MGLWPWQGGQVQKRSLALVLILLLHLSLLFAGCSGTMSPSGGAPGQHLALTPASPGAPASSATLAQGAGNLSAGPTRGGQGVQDTPTVASMRVAVDVYYYGAVRPLADLHLTSLDIYAPPAAHDLPVLIYVHGGGWVGGDHDPVGTKATYFTRRGLILVSVNYRLLPLALPAGQAADVATAVAWVKGHIAAYGGDGSRLFLLGHSAGAHLSALIASDETYLRAVGLDLSTLCGVVLLDSAAYDVEQLMRSPDGQTELYRTAFGTDPTQWRLVSPRAHVAPGKGIPPHLLLLATATGQRRPAAVGLAVALRAAGVYAQVADASAFRDHTTIDADLGQPDDAPTAVVWAFLEMLLAGSPQGLGSQVVLSPGP
jgi:arylformamidase